MLFVEDFDAFDEPPAAAVPARDIEAELAGEYARGVADGTAAAQAACDQGARALVAQLVTECRAAEVGMAALAEKAADELARLVFDALRTLVPSVCAACGPAETAAMARMLLPRLRSEPRIRIKLNPHEAAAVQAELGRLEDDLAERITITPTDAVRRGDLQVSWKDGSLMRDTAAIWREMSGALQQFGFLDAPVLRDAGSRPPRAGAERAVEKRSEQVVEHAG